MVPSSKRHPNPSTQRQDGETHTSYIIVAAALAFLLRKGQLMAMPPAGAGGEGPIVYGILTDCVF